VSLPSVLAAAHSPARTLRLTQLVMRFGFSTLSHTVVARALDERRRHRPAGIARRLRRMSNLSP